VIRRFTLLQIVIHLGAWIPLILLVFDFFAGRLSVNPIQDMEQRTGRAAITLLVLSLACTPLNTLFGWREALKRRRALGLYAFMYASLHMLVFVGLDYALSWSLIRNAILEKRYILVGVLSFLMLLPLVITSFKYWKKRLGRNWTRLHRLIYLIGPLVVLHYAWAKKGDLFHLRGDILRPLIYGLIVVLLLLLRLPPVRRVSSFVRTRSQVLARKVLSIFKRSRRFDGLDDDIPRCPLALISIERDERQVKQHLLRREVIH
jgi:sulfoxide reductase heme-binding subunit YedZ